MNTGRNNTRTTEDRFEQRLHTIVADGIDQRLAPPRSAPAFDPGADDAVGAGDRSRRRRFAPLIAAACVLILAAGVLLATNLLRKDQTQPAQPVPGPQLTHVGGAEIALPTGWVVRDGDDYGGYLGLKGVWCLSPASRPSSTEEGACPIWLFSVPRAEADGVDPDNYGGFPNNGHPCGGGSPDDTTDRGHQAGVRTFGGRPAQWRHWTFGCPAGRTVVFEQYVVTRAPAWILYTPHAAEPRIRDAIGFVAEKSQLPG